MNIKVRYSSKFQRFKKVDVKGENAIPLYKWLICQNEKGKAKSIKWNFTKFLINRNGEVVERYAPMSELLRN